MTDGTMVDIINDVGPMTADELKSFRAKHDLTRTQVAVLLGVARATVRNWEQTSKGGRTMPEPADRLLRSVTRAQIERVKRQHPPLPRGPKRRPRRPKEAASDDR